MANMSVCVLYLGTLSIRVLICPMFAVMNITSLGIKVSSLGRDYVLRENVGMLGKVLFKGNQKDTARACTYFLGSLNEGCPKGASFHRTRCGFLSL